MFQNGVDLLITNTGTNYWNTTMKYVDVEYLESPMKTPIGETFGEFWFSLQFRQPEFKEIEQKR